MKRDPNENRDHKETKAERKDSMKNRKKERLKDEK